MTATFRINRAEYQATVDKVAKINARAVKRGFTGRLAVEATEVEVATKDLYGMRRTEVYLDTTITGEAPKYDGWEFLAVLDWDTADGLIVRTAPGVESVDRDNLADNWCDQCETRRDRRNTYLVRNIENGYQLQVGSTCIKDFLGHDASIVFFTEEGAIAESGLGDCGKSGPDTFGTQYILAIAWALIKLDGFKPASSHGPTTKGDVLDVLLPPRSMTPERRAELARIRDLADQAMDYAQRCLDWVRSDDFGGDNEYVANLKTIAASEHVGIKAVGLLASAPQAWARWQEQTLVRQAQTQAPSEWLGVVDDKVTVTVTVERVQFIPGNYGTKTLYSMRTDDGDVVKWFSSSHVLGDEVGRKAVIKATVKRLETFNGVKQTLITRAKEIKP